MPLAVSAFRPPLQSAQGWGNLIREVSNKNQRPGHPPTLTVTRRFAITKNQVSAEFRREYSEFRSKAAFDMDRRFSSEFSERQMDTP
jgi:hypothetical protein